VVGNDALVSAWVDYQSGDTAWRWWSVALVMSLMNNLGFDDAWHLCVELAHAAAARPKVEDHDPVGMVGFSPMTDLFWSDPDRFVALVRRDAPNDEPVRSAIGRVIHHRDATTAWETLRHISSTG
jgi:hypothetical protein